MATEKYFCFDEQGELKRIKGRLVRFLDNEAPTGSDKSAIRTSLEVSPDAEGLVQADVGTAPNEIPVNGMLGDLAYQDADSVAMGTVSISDKIDGSVEIADEDNCTLTLRSDSDNNSGSRNTQIQFQIDAGTTKGLVSYDQDADVMQMSYGGNNKHLVVDSSGLVGIGNASPDRELTIGNGTGSPNMQLLSSNVGNARIEFGDTDDGDAGEIQYVHSNNAMVFTTNGAEAWRINSSGNLVANSTGIDFGSVAEGSGTPVTNGGLLDDYESGTLTATLTPSNSGTITLASSNSLAYVKVGNLVTVTGKIGVSSVSSPSGSYVYLNLPFTVGSAVRNRCAGTVLISAAASNINTYGVVVENGGSTALICSTDGTSLGGGTTADDFSGNEELHINISYIAA